MISIVGICLLLILALVFELVQHRREHVQGNALHELKRRSESLANQVMKNGGMKPVNSKKGNSNDK